MKDIVCKFGGTSLATFDNIKQICKIIKKKKRRFVVVSAPGKRDNSDTKITDSLISIYNKIIKGHDFKHELNLIKRRFEDIKNGLNVDVDLDNIFDEIKKQISSKVSYDYIVSRGEYINAILISKYLGYEFLDAINFITFNAHGVDLATSKHKLLSLIEDDKCYVIPGFYGVDQSGNIKTFSRGGSDITGAIISAILSCNIYENYTDVDGIMSTNPSVCQYARVIKQLSFDEIRCLSYCGASVLHPDCVNFLKQNNITLKLLNSFNPSGHGSKVVSSIKTTNRLMISGQGDKEIIYISHFAIHNDFEYIEQILQVVRDYGISIVNFCYGIDSMSIIVDKSINNDKAIDELKQYFDNVKLIKNVAIMSIVGEKLKNNIELKCKIYNMLQSITCNILLSIQNLDMPCMMISIPNKELNNTIISLHKALYR